ncbi:MAG: lipoate--protein ligase family protein [Candidatus Desulfofervidaceae bacterium]|nr:lipoate--protein ligase family protein [Candidatus Desulfofervidaceae bacterium]
MKQWRFIYSEFCDPYTNMAIDEAILIAHSEGKTLPTLRIYGWRPPAFSLGCFQKAEEVLDLDRCKKEGVLFVRRITGGEAIFHHLELTYSLVCFKDEINASGSVKEGFKKICSFLLNAYKKLGLNPHFAVDIKLPASEKCPLCFASYEDYDIIVGGKKIGGNAQKRKRDLIFQHGSIPLKLKPDVFMSYLRNKPDGLEKKVCSLTEALGREISFAELADTIKTSFKETFSVNLIEQGFTPEEEKLALKLKKEKYTTEDWNLRR